MLLLSDKDIIRDLKKKLAARKKKRNRLKRMKQENYGVKMLRKQRIEEANKELVEWKKQQITILEEQKRVSKARVVFQIVWAQTLEILG